MYAYIYIYNLPRAFSMLDTLLFNAVLFDANRFGDGGCLQHSEVIIDGAMVSILN